MTSSVSITFEDFSGERSTPTIRTRPIEAIPADPTALTNLAGDFADLSLCQWEKTKIVFSDVETIGEPEPTDPDAQRESVVQFHWETVGALPKLKGYVSLPGPDMSKFPFVAGGGDTISPPFNVAFVNLNQFVTNFNDNARDVNDNAVAIVRLVRTGSSS